MRWVEISISISSQEALDSQPKLPKDILRGEPMINSGAAGSKSPAMAVVPAAANSASRYACMNLAE